MSWLSPSAWLDHPMGDRLARDEWNLGVVNQPIGDIVRHGIISKVHWYPPNPWQIFADPFCIPHPDGGVTILAEKLNHWIGKGEIWQALVPAGVDPLSVAFTPMMSVPAHLSYPFVIDDMEHIYLLAESHEAGALHLWRHDGQQCCYVKTLLHRPAIDATIYRDHTGWWLFCGFADDAPDERLHLFYADSLLGDWTPHPMNPIKDNRANARPGGALFWVNDRLVRPAQNSSLTYGGSLVLNHVVTLSRKTFAEKPIRQLIPDGDYNDGIHTIAAAGSYTLIDGKRWHRGLGNLPCRLSAKLHKIHRVRNASRLQTWKPPHSLRLQAK